jgi:hypothetical protein
MRESFTCVSGYFSLALSTDCGLGPVSPILLGIRGARAIAFVEEVQEIV